MKGFCLDVSGDFACFTRPEMKVERVSYDVITPSAARGIFTAIFWKPAIRWRITRIEVLNPIRWTSVRRNEVSAVASPRTDGIFVEDVRQQRAGLILRDVRYRLHAEFDFSIVSSTELSTAMITVSGYFSLNDRKTSFPRTSVPRPSILRRNGLRTARNPNSTGKRRQGPTKRKPNTPPCSTAAPPKASISCTPISDAANSPSANAAS